MRPDSLAGRLVLALRGEPPPADAVEAKSFLQRLLRALHGGLTGVYAAGREHWFARADNAGHLPETNKTTSGGGPISYLEDSSGTASPETSRDSGRKLVTSLNCGASASDGGTVNVTGGDATGQVTRSPDRSRATGRRQRYRADVGVLTVLTEELAAVVDVLQSHRGYQTFEVGQGVDVYAADVPAEGGGDLRVVATRTLDRGPRSAAAAYDRLHASFAPAVVLLVGIAGGIDPRLDVGDVVIADMVIYYDARRETADGPQRRGQSHPVSPTLQHPLNEFFRRHPSSIPNSKGEDIKIWRGVIGSADMVVTDQTSDITQFLRRFNEKTLAVETEAGGIGKAAYEHLDAKRLSYGWLTIRGISDHADRDKDNAHQSLAARHAALVMDRLLPLLRLGETDNAQPAVGHRPTHPAA